MNRISSAFASSSFSTSVGLTAPCLLSRDSCTSLSGASIKPIQLSKSFVADFGAGFPVSPQSSDLIQPLPLLAHIRCAVRQLHALEARDSDHNETRSPWLCCYRSKVRPQTPTSRPEKDALSAATHTEDFLNARLSGFENLNFIPFVISGANNNVDLAVTIEIEQGRNLVFVRGVGLLSLGIKLARDQFRFYLSANHAPQHHKRIRVRAGNIRVAFTLIVRGRNQDFILPIAVEIRSEDLGNGHYGIPDFALLQKFPHQIDIDILCEIERLRFSRQRIPFRRKRNRSVLRPLRFREHKRRLRTRFALVFHSCDRDFAGLAAPIECRQRRSDFDRLQRVLRVDPFPCIRRADQITVTSSYNRKHFRPCAATKRDNTSRDDQLRFHEIAPKASPRPYVTAASITPTIVISKPDAHHERSVISDLTAPTRKCATMLIANAQTTAAIPLMKKKGMIGMKAPIAVEIAADADDFQGFGKLCSDKPSSLCAIACTIWSGFSPRRSAIFCASSGLNP